jgi:hypothetical protein
MQVGIITGQSSYQVRVLNLGDIPAEVGLALCCEPWKVSRDMPVGLSDGTVLGIALAWVALASLGTWWLWHQRRSQRPTPLKNVLRVVVSE